MNRKNQGQSSRNQNSPASLSQSQRGSARPAQFNQNSQYGQNYGHSFDQDEEGMHMNGRYQNSQNSYESDRSPSYRDTDYDLDGSTYGRAQGMSGSSRNDYETNDRARTPSRASSSSFDEGRSFDRPSQRSHSSSERFGYPSNMDSWRGSERSSGLSGSAGRMGQSSFNSWGSASHDEDSYARPEMGAQTYGQSSYGEGSLGSEYRSHSDMGSQKGFFGKGPKGYKRSDDRIKEDVCETLARHARVDASDIEVKVDDACVTLSGTVDSKEIKRAAEMAIENLSGVEDVRNEIKVKRMGERSERGNDSIHASSSGSNSGTSSKTSSKNSSHM